MNFEVIAVEKFQKETKKLYKKYKSIKTDLFTLIEQLETSSTSGIHLGDNLYKIRIKNSDTGGKRGGYRVIYYTKNTKQQIFLLSIYSKTQQDNINLETLKPILTQIHKL
jgi:hypothetical protein